MSHLIKKVRKENPLIHNITNEVVMNFTANGLYAMGASPVMAHAKEEVEEMAQLADALVINIGTLTQELVDVMILAGKAANKAGTPVVLDPVGTGATQFRTNCAKKILEQVEVTTVRGNAGEIANLAGADIEVRGVDGATEANMDKLAETAFDTLNVPLIITGATDTVVDKDGMSFLTNGDEMLTKITGAGCSLSSVIAAFLAVSDRPRNAAEDALSFYGVAAENAARYHSAPGSFQTAFLDQLYQLQAKEVEEKYKISRG